VLAYQAWTYYVFRRRVSARDFEAAKPAAGATVPGPRSTEPPEPAAQPAPAGRAQSAKQSARWERLIRRGR
jgi:hypothetical protein